MIEFVAPDYDVARQLLQRGIGLVYLIAFANVHNQFRPLLGERGLLPVPRFLDSRSFGEAPSLFQWRYSDRLVGVVAWSGMAIAAFVVAGGIDVVPVAVGMAAWLALWALYLSVVNVGQLFYGFGWESLLLEAGFLAVFLGNASTGTPWVTLVLFRWLLFRVELGAGLIKMRGDRCWRNLTCLDYHHETQPMPNPLSRRFHLLPGPLHRVEVAANHVAQLVAPVALFLPQPAAGVAAVLMILTQAYLMVSGNYAWLNLITLVLAFSAVPDGWWGAAVATGDPPGWFQVAVVGAGLAVGALSHLPVRNLLTGRQLMNFSFNRYHLVNTYGAFGSITRERREVIIEAALTGEDGSRRWVPYEFRGKPGDPSRRPPQVAPYHLRLDWLMWFAALSPSYRGAWFETLLVRLGEGDRATLRLLGAVPFPGSPPEAVRARLVDYRFATPVERRANGNWWVTGHSQELVPPVRPDGGRLVPAR